MIVLDIIYRGCFDIDYFLSFMIPINVEDENIYIHEIEKTQINV